MDEARTPLKSSAFEVRPLHPSLGAEVTGLDLARPLDAATVTALKEAWARYQVLVMRGQSLSEEQQIAFSRHFGTLDVHIENDKTSHKRPEILRVANVDEDGNKLAPTDPIHRYYSVLTSVWHTDGSYRVVPSFASTLHALEIPPEGGDTCFANCRASYAALPDEMKRRLAGKHMVHSYAFTRYYADLPPLSAEQLEALPPVTHPVVRTHADGSKSLYLSANVARYVGGMAREDGEKLLTELLAWATKPEFVYQHKWQVGDVLMWDNRATLHKVTPWDAGNYRRALQRTELKGTEIPV
jgi:alpha-ketoglutarate-dependent taurine dioxygenase